MSSFPIVVETEGNFVTTSFSIQARDGEIPDRVAQMLSLVVCRTPEVEEFYVALCTIHHEPAFRVPGVFVVLAPGSDPSELLNVVRSDLGRSAFVSDVEPGSELHQALSASAYRIPVLRKGMAPLVSVEEYLKLRGKPSLH